MQPSKTDVLIVGAGVAGLVLAIDLARRGVAFRLVEKRDQPFVGSKGKGLQPRSLEIFEALGLIEPILGVGAVYPPVWTYENGEVIVRAPTEVREASPAEPYPNSLMVPQWKTEAALRERLAALGAAPEFGVELTALEADASEVRATLSSPEGEEKVVCAYLVGTDGGGSFVRRALDIGFPGERRPFRMVLADMAIDNLSREAWHRWPHAPGGQLSLCPLAGTDLFQVAAQIDDDAAPDLSRVYFDALIRNRSGRQDLAGDEPSWTSVYHANFRRADRYRVGRVLIAGDAAHAHPPTGGQGLNTAVQDAYNLGWKLAHVVAGAPAHLLDTYEAERRPIAADVLDLSANLLDAMNQRHDMRRGRETLQLDLNYRGSILASELRARPGRVQAGDRAPDAPCQDRQGVSRRLFEVFQGPGFTLLGYGWGLTTLEKIGAASRTPVNCIRVTPSGRCGDLIDAGGHIARIYGLDGGAFILVRPDGYVGLAADIANPWAVADYLNTWRP